MQPSNSIPETHSSAEDLSDAAPSRRGVRSLVILLVVLLFILLLTFIPPLLNVSRFQQRIATNIGASLGRPVHFDRVNLSLIPLPGFTLENFVVEEDPAFGSEPILQADEVRATVRLSSLWGRRVEFSKISLTEPSVNLVHSANGQWNLQSVLLRASHIEAAPTGQRNAGPAPRFPYIEATGARLNFKLDQEKAPYSLTDADFALWLPEPRQWHFRLEAHPARTDTAPAETGTLRLEGTLGNPDTGATTLAAVPINLHGDWENAQLAGLSRLLLGRDAGLRGDLTLDINVLGALGHAAIATHIQLAHGRRADFVPPNLLSLEASCQATAEQAFRSFSAIECHSPPAGSSKPGILDLTAAVPDTRTPALSSADISLPAVPFTTLLDWLRVASSHPPTGLAEVGTLTGSLAWRPSNSTPPEVHLRQQTSQPQPVWSGELTLSGESLQAPGLAAGTDTTPIPLGTVLLRSSPPPAPPPHSHGSTRPATTPRPASSFDLLPISLPLGGKQPATLEGHFDATGYTLHLTGTAIPARLLALADAIPQFGDGLRQLLNPTPDPTAETAPIAVPSQALNSNAEADPSTDSDSPMHIDLTATRAWGSPQVWRETQPAPAPHHHK